MRTATQVVDGLVVHAHQSDACACFDGHVAQRHAALHAEIAHCAAGKLDGIACGARCAQHANDVQHQILGCETRCQWPLHADLHAFHGTDRQALRRQHMFHIGGTHPKGQRAKGTMRAGVRVTGHHRHARQRGPLLGADDMDDALRFLAQAMEGDAKLLTVQTELPHLGSRQRVFDGVYRCALGRRGGDVVVSHGDRRGGSPWLAV